MPTGAEPDSSAGLPVPTGDGDTGGLRSGVPSQPGGEPPILEAERIPHRAPDRKPRRAAVRLAWAVALATDAFQWILWPLLAEGVASPINDIVDVITAALLIRLLGWHWAFLPAFLAEIIPGVDLVPTWTAAVFLATRGAPGGSPAS